MRHRRHRRCRRVVVMAANRDDDQCINKTKKMRRRNRCCDACPIDVPTTEYATGVANCSMIFAFYSYLFPKKRKSQQKNRNDFILILNINI